MRLSSAPPNYYIVGCMKPGSSGETSHIVRRFTREEDRDRFESLLNKFGWSSFTSKPLWKLTMYGDPCLAVSSAAVYTLQEVMPYQSYEQRLRMFLKLSV
ncbi:hypothetical protein BT96DRAFT_929534 [Gymnopus androsaceus JB14]|uniref:Uncharacterized protein n=1 Tax=Gymnopus androsaceus JB14 TaxID=1447944 RepID=A0A6A4GEC9_9AGAR|nr:hypothetical protein BT96DRAFT_929534 [Gymnopus androsaceus JB14]